MSGNITGQGGQQHPYAQPVNRPMAPGEGPVLDFLRQFTFPSQTFNPGHVASANGLSHAAGLPQNSHTQQNDGRAMKAPSLEHWTITKYDGPTVPQAKWRVCRRHNDGFSDSKIKEVMEKQRKPFKSPLKLESSELSPNRKRQIKDLIKHRNLFDPDPMNEWVLKALDQTKKNGDVKAVHVVIGRKACNNPRQITRAASQYRWPDVHAVEDPEHQKTQQRAAHFNPSINDRVAQQHRPDSGPNSYFQLQNGQQGQQSHQNPLLHQHHQGGQPHLQMAQMPGHGAAASTMPQVTAQTDQARAHQQQDHHKHPANAKVGAARMHQQQGADRHRAAKPKPKIIQVADSEDSSLSSHVEESDWDDEAFSAAESAPTEYSHHSRQSRKFGSYASDKGYHEVKNHSSKQSRNKPSKKSYTSEKQFSRHHKGGSESSSEEMPSDDSFVEARKARRDGKTRKHASRGPEIRHHTRPEPRGASSRGSSRRYSQASGELQPHSSNRSHKTTSHSRQYSLDSLGSSPRDLRYPPSSRQSTYGSQQYSQGLWELEQKGAQLEMEHGLRSQQMEERKRRLDERELSLYRRENQYRNSIAY